MSIINNRVLSVKISALSLGLRQARRAAGRSSSHVIRTHHAKQFQADSLTAFVRSISGHRPLAYSYFVSRFHSTTTGSDPVTPDTVDSREIEHFSVLASSWWDESGPMKALHSMNALRVPWIKDTLLQYSKMADTASPSKPLSGFKILDVGCGAGILSEPLARLGGSVTGLDASEDCIAAAELRAQSDNKLRSHLKYRVGSPEDISNETFNAVVASEILEHVQSRHRFLEACVSLLKPGGVIFLTTLNKTLVSRVLGIFVAEEILKIVPSGTHEWDKFTPPDDLKLMLQQTGCNVRLIHGMEYNPFWNRWSWSSRTFLNYATHAVKKE